MRPVGNSATGLNVHGEQRGLACGGTLMGGNRARELWPAAIS
ncbi:hypothetical protein [Arthrobacter sp. N199823]|nr:hypothetical protein [Arthrobacter sp. N199823]